MKEVKAEKTRERMKEDGNDGKIGWKRNIGNTGSIDGWNGLRKEREQ
jgi:hypothetical protein